MASRVAVVTGGNKGIGLSCVKFLAKEITGPVYLTSRNEKLGHEAVDSLKKEMDDEHWKKVKYHQLDVTDQQSINNLRDFLKKEHGGFDILVNNAAVWIQVDDPRPLDVQNEITLKTNYFGVKNVSHTLFPLLRPHSRVVIVASRGGNLRSITNEEIRKQFSKRDMSEADLDQLMNNYLDACKNKKQTELGYSQPYSVSKILVIALSRILAKQLQNDPREDIILNAVCPGMVATDMTTTTMSRQQLKVGAEMLPGVIVKTPDQGADVLVYGATIPKGAKEPIGEFIGERKVLDWENEMSLAEGYALKMKLEKEKQQQK